MPHRTKHWSHKLHANDFLKSESESPSKYSIVTITCLKKMETTNGPFILRQHDKEVFQGKKYNELELFHQEKKKEGTFLLAPLTRMNADLTLN